MTTRRRWAVLGVLALLAVMWWWLTWPTRTAKRFLGHINARQVDGAKRMTVGDFPPRVWVTFEAKFLNSWRPVMYSRTVTDMLLARQNFYVLCTWEDGRTGTVPFNDEEFVSMRGSIAFRKP